MGDSLARNFQLQNCCQECGRPFKSISEKKGIVLTFDGLSYKGKKIPLTLRESKILKVLLQTNPHAVAREHLFNAVWTVDTEVKILDVYICKIRKKLKNSGIKIESIWGVGHRLVLE